MKIDKIVNRKEVVIAWREIYRICGINDNLKRKLSVVTKEKTLIEKDNEKLKKSGKNNENKTIALLFENATLKNKIKNIEKKLSESKEKSLKYFIEESIMKEANNYEIRNKTEKINVQNSIIKGLQNKISMNVLSLKILEDKVRNKEKSFELLKNELNKMMKEKTNLEEANRNNSKYISSLKTKASENDIKIEMLENNYQELLNKYDILNRPKRRKLKFFCF